SGTSRRTLLPEHASSSRECLFLPGMPLLSRHLSIPGPCPSPSRAPRPSGHASPSRACAPVVGQDGNVAEEHEFDIMAGATASPAEPSRPSRPRRIPRARGTHRSRRLWTGPLLWVCCAAALVLAGVVVVPHEQGPVGPWGQVEDVTTAPQPAWTYQAIPT